MDFKNIFNKQSSEADEIEEEILDDDQMEDSDEEYNINPDSVLGITATEIAEYEQMLQQSKDPTPELTETQAPQKSVTGRFAIPGSIEEMKVTASVIEELLLKTLFQIGEATGIELANRLRASHNTIVAPTLMSMADRGFVQILRATGMGGHNKAYILTEKGRKQAREDFAVSSYVGPVPVALEDYVDAVNNYPALRVPPFPEFKNFYKDLVVDDKFLQDFAVALASGECLFLYGTPGMGKTTFVKKFIECSEDTIMIPFSVFIEGDIVQFFDKEFHEPVNEAFSIDVPLNDVAYDQRWIEIKRPCVLVGTEFSAVRNTDVQYHSTGSSCSFPVTTKANGGVFILDDFGRQVERPDQILNLWIGKLEGAEDVMTMKTGQQFTAPYKTLSIFTTNLDPETLMDDAFLRRLSYKLQIPDVTLENYCQIFAMMADKEEIIWDDSILEYLIGEYYQKYNIPLAGDQPRGLIKRAKNICQYMGMQKPYKLSRELIDRAWQMHFIKKQD